MITLSDAVRAASYVTFSNTRRRSNCGFNKDTDGSFSPAV